MVKRSRIIISHCKINPKYADAYNNRGLTEGKLGKHREAIQDFDRAIAANPKHAEAFVNRGTVKEKLGNRSSAIADYKKALAIDPDYLDAQRNLTAAQNAQ